MKCFMGILVLLSMCVNGYAKTIEDSNAMEPVYKILRQKEFNDLRNHGHFVGGRDDLNSGFIHLATESQLDRIIKKYYPKEHSVYIVKFSNRNFLKTLTWEVGSNGDLYPHLYGAYLLLSEMDSFEVRSNCISLAQARSSLREYLDSKGESVFNMDFPWFKNELKITSDDIQKVVDGLTLIQEESLFMTHVIVSRGDVDHGDSEWGYYTLDCRGGIGKYHLTE